jgi:arabinose-5-phosphate isomerase
MQSQFIQSALRVLEIEKEAIEQLAKNLDDSFSQACELIMACKGKVIVSGMGKSGHIGNKIASTLASTGTPAFFMHPGEANHGDLGMLTDADILLAISNSGETSELIALLPVVKRRGVPIIAMSNSVESSLGKYADVHISIKVAREACSLGLAPTSSTTATLVMGDALAIALLDAKGFTSEDFALYHPGGSLGRKLLLRLQDIMYTGDRLPLVDENQSISLTLSEISKKGLGMAGVVNSQGKLVGIFTDGDLRRMLDARVDVHGTPICQVMTVNCTTGKADMLAAEALNVMEKRKINGLLVIDDNDKPVGALNMLTLLAAGVV